MVVRTAAPPAPPAHREETSQYLAELYVRARHRRAPLPPPAEGCRGGRGADRLAPPGPARLTTRSASRASPSIYGVRLRNAAELLARQPLTVADVARLVGYRRPSHFVKAFGAGNGMTPGAFREAARRRAQPGARAQGQRGNGVRRSTPPGRRDGTSRSSDIGHPAGGGSGATPTQARRVLLEPELLGRLRTRPQRR
jgi:hypothetical protein